MNRQQRRARASSPAARLWRERMDKLMQERIQERVDSEEGEAVQSYIKHIVERWGAFMVELREEAERAAAGNEEQEAEMRSIRATAVLAGASAYFDKFVPNREKDTYMRAAQQWTAMFQVRDGGVERYRTITDPDGNWMHRDGHWYTPEGTRIQQDKVPATCHGHMHEDGTCAVHPWTRYHRDRCEQRCAPKEE